MLFNGKIWKGRYGHVKGNEFFLSDKWHKGSASVNNILFDDVNLKYDLFNDQLLTIVNPGTIIILNSESVGWFEIFYEGNSFRFENFSLATNPPLKGYVQLIHDGITRFYAKYSKLIKPLAVENRYDEFYQKHSLWLLRNGEYHRLSSRKNFISIMDNGSGKFGKKIKEENLRFSLKDPESLVPVIELGESLFNGPDK